MDDATTRHNGLGLTVWYTPPPPSEVTVDICFIHGLNGGRESTWAAKKVTISDHISAYIYPRGDTTDSSTPLWPKTLLEPNLPKARLLAFGYDSSTGTLDDYAQGLLDALAALRKDDAPSRPIIFIAHSLGGLVCKRLMILSADKDSQERTNTGIHEYTVGIFFMGTPHTGSSFANAGSWAESLRNGFNGLIGAEQEHQEVLSLLELDNSILYALENNLQSLYHSRRDAGRCFEIVCFYETEKFYNTTTIVSQESATFGALTPIPIHENHINMVKFEKDNEAGFKALLWKLEWTETLAKNLKNESLQKCLQSLAFPDMEKRFEDIKGPEPGTLQWLSDHDVYQGWETSDRGLLWIKGKPGSGKSTLLQKAVKDAGVLADRVVLSFFFHGRGVELQRTPLGFLRSLLYQLLRVFPLELTALVTQFQTNCDRKGKSKKDWDWGLNELQDFLSQFLPVILTRNSVWLYVDALDECGEKGASNLVELFRSLLQTPPAANPAANRLHICITSRKYSILDVDESYSIANVENQHIIFIDNENGTDISTYVRNALNVLRSMRDGRAVDPAETREIDAVEQSIIDEASGGFLRVHLVTQRVIKHRAQGMAWPAIKREIRSNPKQLGDLYQKIVDEGVEDGALSLKLIQWICFAQRPLTLDELQWALVIDFRNPSQSLEAYRAEIVSAERFEQQIQALSGGLAEVVSPVYEPVYREVTPQVLAEFFQNGAPSAISEQYRRVSNRGFPQDMSAEDIQSARRGASIVQFTHQSVKDYFINKGLSALDITSTSRDSAIQNAHYQISRTCIRCLSMREMNIHRRRDDMALEFPLLRYASSSWIFHESQVQEGTANGDELLYTLKWPSKNIIQLWEYLESESSAGSSHSKTSLLHIASRYGWTEPLSAIMRKSPLRHLTLNPKDDRGWTPLAHAAAAGNLQAAELLLENESVDADLTDSGGRTPLSLAAGAGHVEVVQLLLDTQRADPDIQDSSGRTSLSLAAGAGHVEVVKLLLDTQRANPDIQDRDHRTPLSHAAELGRIEVVKLLLERTRATINARDDRGMTPLSHAAASGHPEVVSHLLSQGADFCIGDVNERRPISHAADFGCEVVIDHLLKADTENLYVNAHSMDDIAPVLRAALRGHQKAVLRFLQTGSVDVNAAYYEKPLLSFAAESGHIDVVKELLKGNAIIDQRDFQGKTPLWYAASSGCVEVVSPLLARAQEENQPRPARDVVNQACGLGVTPVMEAVRGGHQQVVKLFLDTGLVDINARDNQGMTPLSHAAIVGHEGIVDLLLKVPGIEINARDNQGMTPLSHAAIVGYERIVDLLLKVPGIEINARDNQGMTPLSHAATHGHERIVGLLLKVPGIDVNARDNSQRTPLLNASHCGRLDVVHILLKKPGVDISPQPGTNRTLLSAAAEWGRPSIFRSLLESNLQDLNTVDIYERTPLAYAAANGHQDAVRSLLDAENVDINKADVDGMTPLMWAVEGGYPEVVGLLLARDDIVVNARDVAQGTAAWYAKKFEYGDIVQLFKNWATDHETLLDMGERPDFAARYRCRQIRCRTGSRIV